MAHHVNLSTFGNDLANVYNKILAHDSKENWALLGYDKNTNDLKVVGSGDGGLEELQDEFEDSKIQYAFVRVLDSSSGLLKYVFINWCGDGVPVSRKALMPSHVQDVKNRFKGFHVEITARTSVDVEPKVIMKKVLDSSGAKYSHQQTDLKHVKKDLVDKSPERAAPQDPVAKLRAERELRDKELFEREKKTATEESKRYVENPTPVNEPKRLAEKPLVVHEIPKSRHFAPNEVSKSSERIRAGISESNLYQQQQAQEAHVDSVKPSKLADEAVTSASKSVRNVWAEREKASQENLSTIPTKSHDSIDRDFSSFRKPPISEIANNQAVRHKIQERRIPPPEEPAPSDSKLSLPVPLVHDNENESYAEPLKETLEEVTQVPTQEVEHIATEIENVQLENAPINSGVTARALYNFTASDQSELSFFEGQIISQIIQIDEGWWHGSIQGSHGQIISGIFPSNYVETISDSLLETGQDSQPATATEVEDIPMSGFSVRALYDYKASEENEITFNEGDLISDVQIITEDWWSGTSPSGKVGLFPQNYVEKI